MTTKPYHNFYLRGLYHGLIDKFSLKILSMDYEEGYATGRTLIKFIERFDNENEETIEMINRLANKLKEFE